MDNKLPAPSDVAEIEVPTLEEARSKIVGFTSFTAKINWYFTCTWTKNS